MPPKAGRLLRLFGKASDWIDERTKETWICGFATDMGIHKEAEFDTLTQAEDWARTQASKGRTVTIYNGRRSFTYGPKGAGSN